VCFRLEAEAGQWQSSGLVLQGDVWLLFAVGELLPAVASSYVPMRKLGLSYAAQDH
jgi:hypothetical protein